MFNYKLLVIKNTELRKNYLNYDEFDLIKFEFLVL